VKGKRGRTEQHLSGRGAKADRKIASKDCERHFSAMDKNIICTSDVILQPAAETPGRGGDCDGDVGDEFWICNGLVTITNGRDALESKES
jgi:hypothetical protein